MIVQIPVESALICKTSAAINGKMSRFGPIWCCCDARFFGVMRLEKTVSD